MTNQHITGPEAHARPDPTDDEIDLTDLALIVWRRRRLVLVVVLLALLAGAAFAFMNGPVYEYRTTVEVSTQVEDVNTALSKLSDAYIPLAISTVMQESEKHPNIKISANVPKGATIITLFGKAAKSHEDFYIKAMRMAVDSLIADHGRILDTKKLDLRLNIERKRTEIEDANRQIALLQLDRKLTEARILDIEGNVKRLQIQLAEDTETAKKAVRSVSNEPSAMTLLLLESQRRSALQWLTTLQDTVMDLQRRKEKIQADILATEQAKIIKASEIGFLEEQEKALSETRLIYGPAPSFQPALSRSLVMILALVIGAFVGIMAAFIAEFVVNVRERLREVADTDTPAYVES